MPQSMKEFAGLFRQALQVAGMTQGELARRSGIDRTTLSRYKNPHYKSGPPRAMTKRVLERVLEIPEGWLDGDVTVDLALWRRQQRQRAAAAPVPPVVSGTPEATARAMLHSVEQQLEGVQRQVESVRRMLGGPEANHPPQPSPRVTPAEVAAVLEEEHHLERLPAPPTAHRRTTRGHRRQA